MNPLGPCFVILTQKVPGVCDSSELHSMGTLRSGRKGQYTPQLSSYLQKSGFMGLVLVISCDTVTFKVGSHAFCQLGKCCYLTNL